MTGTKANLEGGPDDLLQRVIPILYATGIELKIPHKGGYEHFKATHRHKDTEEGRFIVFEWTQRTS